MFNSKRMVALIISCVFVVQILTSTVFNKIGFSDVQAASQDYAYETLLQSVEESNESTKIGDVDGNGQINSIDFARMRMHLLGMIKSFPVSNGTWAADVTGDGIFNSIDFAFMRMYMLGKIKKFPAEENDVTPTPSTSVTPVYTDANLPSKPEALECSLLTGTTVSLNWEPSTEGDVKYYAVYKDDESVALTNGETEYTLKNLIPDYTYEFKVCALDEAGNKSEFSDTCVVKTKASDMEDLKIGLIHNFNQKGTDYSLTYEGDITDIQTNVNQALTDAIDESDKPFMLQDVSYSMSGHSGDFQITFEFVYDDENEYIAVARSTEEIEKALVLGFYNRTQDINIIYKGTISGSEIESARESALNYDTYIKTCISSYEGTVVSNSNLGINAIRIKCSYKTTKEQEEYIDKTVEFIVSKLTNIDMSEDEKEKLIHDYILTNVDYCEGEEYGNAYSALYEGKAKCDGYAMLTYKMLKAAGIENKIVTNEDHAWNIVKINDKWYHMDTTWDDAKKKDFGFYKYYNLSDDEILETRNYDNEYGIECTSNYIDDLTERNSDGKYEEILKDLKKNDDYYFINRFNSNVSLDLLYNEIILKEGETISLVDDKISPELYEGLYQWSTSDHDVATVSNGIITAEKAGTIVISAQPMYNMLSTVSLFCRVHVMPVDSEDDKTPQVLSQENINDLADVGLQLTINSEDDINSTTTVTKAEDSLEGKVWSVVEPVDISCTSEFDWAEIGFKLTQEQLEVYDINDLVIYWYDEKTGTIVPQATIVDEESGVVSATVNHFSPHGVTTRQSLNLTTTIAFVIDSEYSDQTSLDKYKENILSTINGLRNESNVRVILIDAKTNETICDFISLSGDFFVNSYENTKNRIDSAFDKITPGEKTPTNDEILATVNSGMTNGNGKVSDVNLSGHKDNKYILFYTQWDARFVDNNDVVIKMGDTIGAVIGNTVEYYAGGPISYYETDVKPLVEFLLEGNYTQLGSDKEKIPWKLSQDGSNIKDDVIVLQKILVSLGLLEMPIDSSTGEYVSFGTYGSLTKTAVEEFQENNGLHKDGIVGNDTWNKMMLPWDEENAQPDRNTWSYKYVLENNRFFAEKPEVTLNGSYDETKLEVGKSIKITAKGTNCHHLALFVNGEWVKTVYGEMNTNHINLEYEYEIPDVGDYTIQVKGRNIPGNKGGILEKSEIIEIEGFIPDRKFAENIWVYLEMIEDYQAIIDAGNATLLGAECSTIEEVETYKLNLRHVVQYLQYELIENPLVRDNSVVSKYIAQKIIYGDKIDLADDLFIRQQLRANNSVIDEVFGEYVDKMWQEYKDMIIDALPGVISMGLNFVPIIGTLKSVAEGIVGYDLITKNEFAWWERALNIGLAPISFASEVGMLSAAMKNAKLLPKLTDIANIAGDVRVMAIIDKIGAIKTSLKSAPEKVFQKVKSVISKGDELKIITTDGLELRFSETQLVAELRAGGMTDDAAKSAVKCLKNGCFSGDTLVTTKDGLKRIDQIQEGEMVLSKDVNTGTIDYRQVKHVYVKSTYEFVHLTLGNEEIRTTASHLFFTDSGWWKAAENLKYGDRILNNKGEYETLLESSVETLQQPEKIYNLNVDEFHTYFVGASGLLVHNNCTEEMIEHLNSLPRILDEAGNAIPHGFSSLQEYKSFIANLKNGLPSDTRILFQGSSVTGVSHETGELFDLGRVSDFDIGLVQDDTFIRALDADSSFGFKMKTDPNRIGPLNTDQLNYLGLKNIADQMTTQAGRPVKFMLYDSLSEALRRPSIYVE